MPSNVRIAMFRSRNNDVKLMSAISLENVTKMFGTMPAVDGVDLSADEGSLLVLLGPSDCGKSTMLLEQPDGGVRTGGSDVTGQTLAQRKISMVFQSCALFPHLTVAENIIFG
jgi:sn-glycerol 3-phosphate transport system ATP-binding protein